jgi:phosphonatase-like hydrolase
MNEATLVIFDMAGTTVKDRGEVADAFTSALAEHRIALTSGQLQDVRGASKRQAVMRFIPEGPDRASRAETVYASFREHLARRYRTDGVEPIAGAERVFQWLRERGVRVALTTGFDRDTAGLLLDALRWRECAADAVICGDDVKQGRPAPYLIHRAMEATGTTDVHRVANVGDTALDLESAYHAGVRWNIGVLSGAHDRYRLEQAPHTHIWRSVAELIESPVFI